jgi:type I restriction enzyme S subunit
MVREKNVKFGDLFKTKINKKHISSDEEVVFIGMQDVSEDGKIINQNVIKYLEVKKGLTYFEKNDVLVAKITPSFENSKGAFLGKLITEKGVGSTEFHVLRAKSHVEPKYVFYHTQSKKFRKQLERKMIGSAGQRRVPIHSIINYPLAITHTLPEQKAIAKILSDVDELITSVEKLIDKKQKIKQGTMQMLLTGKKRLPGFTGEWEIKQVKYLGEIVTGGTPSTIVREFWGGTIPWVTPTDIGNNKDINNTERKITNLGLSMLKKLPINSVLVTCIASIGKNAILKKKGACNQQINAIIPNRSHSADFVYYLMENNKHYLISKAGMTATNIIPKRDFSEIFFSIPPLPEQKAIAQILSDMDSEIEALEKKLEKYKLIKEGMMDKLLTGKVRLV